MLPKKHKRRAKVFLNKLYIILGVLIILFIIMGLWSMKKPLYISPFPLSGASFLKIISSNSTKQTIESLLKSHAIVYSSINEDQNKYIVYLQNGEKVLFDAQKPIDTQISSLQLLLSRLTIEGKHFETLDFRYNKPVIVLKK